MRAHLITLLAGVAMILTLGSSAAAEEPTADSLKQKAREINSRLLLVDTHVDIPAGFGGDGLDAGELNDNLQVDLPKMAAGGVDCVFLVAYSPQGPRTPEGYEAARREAGLRIEAIRRLCLEQYPERAGLALSPDEVAGLRAAGKLALVIGMENGYPVARDPERLDEYYRQGVRYLTLCHNGHNDICDSANPLNPPFPEGLAFTDPAAMLLRVIYLVERYHDSDVEPEHGGLSGFGALLVERMNRLGMLVDISHAGERTVSDVLAASRAPVIASHSSCRALCDNPRNLTDDQLRAVAAAGGCVQITAVRSFLSMPREKAEVAAALLDTLGLPPGGYQAAYDLFNTDRERYDRLNQRLLEGLKGIMREYPEPGLEVFLDHIDHAVRVAGIEHVGIGTDFGGGGGVEGFADASEAVNVTAGLLGRGYSEQEIGMIWGGNFMRVWRGALEVAARMR